MFAKSVDIMPAVLSMPRRRLRSKTWLGFEIVDVDPSDCGTPAQGPTAKLCYITEEQLEQEDGTSSRKVYQVTFLHSAVLAMATPPYTYTASALLYSKN